MLGLALNVQSAIPALLGTASAKAATQSHKVSPLHNGDLVRVRSGGPLMTVIGVRGDQANCFWTDEGGELRSEAFPIAALTEPVTIPSENRAMEQDERAVDRYYEKHCPTGVVLFTGRFQCAL